MWRERQHYCTALKAAHEPRTREPRRAKSRRGPIVHETYRLREQTPFNTRKVQLRHERFLYRWPSMLRFRVAAIPLHCLKNTTFTHGTPWTLYEKDFAFAYVCCSRLGCLFCICRYRRDRNTSFWRHRDANHSRNRGTAYCGGYRDGQLPRHADKRHRIRLFVQARHTGIISPWSSSPMLDRGPSEDEGG